MNEGSALVVTYASGRSEVIHLSYTIAANDLVEILNRGILMAYNKEGQFIIINVSQVESVKEDISRTEEEDGRQV